MKPYGLGLQLSRKSKFEFYVFDTVHFGKLLKKITSKCTSRLVHLLVVEVRGSSVGLCVYNSECLSAFKIRVSEKNNEINGV